MIDKPKPTPEANPLTKEGLMERKRLVSFRGRVSFVLLSLGLVLHCGDSLSDKVAEEPAQKIAEATPEKPKNPALQFLGEWGLSLKGIIDENIVIRSWAPEGKADPPKELGWGKGIMKLVLPVKFKMNLGAKMPTKDMQIVEFFGGIYKLPEGDYFLACKDNLGLGYRMKIAQGDLLFAPVYIKNSQLSPSVWLTFKRIK